jgi:hypothetical protein
MTEQTSPTSFSFHIEGGVADSHAVPATVLVQILENAQRAFELIGVHVEGRGIKERARVSYATSQRFQLVCKLPELGSYAMPIKIGGTGELFSADLASKAFDIFRGVMEKVSARSSADLTTVLPDNRILRRVLEAVKGMAPRAGAQWKLSLHDAQEMAFATFDIETIPFVEATLVPVEQREAARVVTGELKSIDFTERKVTIIYPPTNKELACIYEDAVEDLLYEKRRDLIQVTGRVLLDDQGEPNQIIDVTDIRDLDLSALVLDTVRHAGLMLKAVPVLAIEPVLDETKQLLCIEQADLGIDVFATTREALLAELQEQLWMLWQEYAKATDDELHAPARALKYALLSRFNEVTHAP